MKSKKIKNKNKIITFAIAIAIISMGTSLLTYYKSHANFNFDNKSKGEVSSFYDEENVEIAVTIDGVKSSTFPEKGEYVVNINCGDTATAKWNYDKWGLLLTNAKAEKVKCNVNFTLNSIANNITTLASTDTTNLAYDGTSDNNLRYIGKDPSNYLCFDEKCSNGTWRIIGVMNNIKTESKITQSLVKIIRADSLGDYAWDSDRKNNWATASLNTLLNSGELYETYIKDYDNLIESVVWKLGGWNSSNLNTIEYYTYERGTTVPSGNATEWTGKVALMYPSDYGYATSGGSTKNRDTCLKYSLLQNSSSNYWAGNSDCYSNDYLKYGYEWTLMPSTKYTMVAYLINTGVQIVDDSVTGSTYPIRPTLYLKSTTSILSGEGTSTNPWIIGVDN
jgi:hypothetical protein